jgi:hypothetical protein
MSFRLLFHLTGHSRTLLASLDENTACRFAQSESGVCQTRVSLWKGGNLIAAFDCGNECDLTPEQVQQAQ